MDLDHSKLVTRAQGIVESSHLAVDEKKLLIGRLPFVSSMMLGMFVQICEEDPFSVEMLVKNLKAKIDAQGNLQKIHEIVKQEREEFAEALAMA
jgi:hypothetical protein